MTNSTAPAQRAIWILGSSDLEMERIEALLIQTRCPFIHAMAGARRVHGGNAYKADPPVIPEGVTMVFAVKCGWESEDTNVFHIDHRGRSFEAVLNDVSWSTRANSPGFTPDMRAPVQNFSVWGLAVDAELNDDILELFEYVDKA